MHRPSSKSILKWSVAVLLSVLVISWSLGFFPELREALDSEVIIEWVLAKGLWGPILIVFLMTLAIVASPLPSAPIAVAAGAVYGHTVGTLYVVLGAEIGALAAFGLARLLGRELIGKYLGGRVKKGWLGSQNALTFVVFGSRLMPFVSFDMVSYLAGLSNLHFWRFAVATLAGVVPASFILAHFGKVAARSDSGATGWLSIGLVLLSLAPLAIIVLKEARKPTSRAVN